MPKGRDSSFSVPVLGNVYDQLLRMHQSGAEVSLGALTDLSQEEMSHVTGIVQRLQGTVSRDAFRDCVQTVRSLNLAANIQSDDELLAFRNKLKERKGTDK